MKKARMKTPKETYTVDYPEAIKAAEDQMAIIWFAEEMGVEKDESDVRTKMTEGERHGLNTVLKLFTQYELEIGQEYWSGRYARMFPRPDLRRAANAFAFMELNVHAPFYALINETLNIASDEFYLSWKDSEYLTDRMDFVESAARHPNDYLSLAAFTFMEGVVLYSSFAYLKSFNVNGHNMIPHIGAGTDGSAKDEDSHAVFSAWSFRQMMLEEKELGIIDETDIEYIKHKVAQIAREVYEHEKRIVDMIFEKGGIRTIHKEEILHFIRNRIDLVLEMLNMEMLFGDEAGVVTEWFYQHLNSYKHSDFFSNSQVQYVRSWNKSELVFKEEE